MVEGFAWMGTGCLRQLASALAAIRNCAHGRRYWPFVPVQLIQVLLLLTESTVPRVRLDTLDAVLETKAMLIDPL